MLSRIKEERLPVIAAPVDSRAFSDELNSARSHVLDLISRHLTEFGDKFPAETCQNGFYPLTDNVEWTTSFWTGQLWLAWEMSGEEKFRAMAEKHVRSFGLRIAGRNDTNTHDLGFLYTLSCVAAWRLTGNREARGFSLLAAEALLERFHEKAKIIQAWGDLSDPEQAGRMIIDCNMNLPLLYWATEQTGDPRFADAAKRTSCRRRRISFVTMPPPSTPTIWMCNRRTALRQHPAGLRRRLLLVARAGVGHLRFPAELYLYRRRNDDRSVKTAGELLPQSPAGRLRLPLGSGAGGHRRAA